MHADTLQSLSWMPLHQATVEVLPVGQWWDAVRVCADLGESALQLLGDDSGAVIEDAHGRRLYWLVQPGSAQGWDLPGTHVLTETAHEITYLGVPPAGRTTGPGPYWKVPVSPGRWLTDSERLRTALHTANAVDADQQPV